VKQALTGKQQTTVLFAALCLVLLLVVLQLWLLSATMNAYLGGDETVLWPAALVSLGCFLVNARLVRVALAATGGH
jgi:hypothetical protein